MAIVPAHRSAAVFLQHRIAAGAATGFSAAHRIRPAIEGARAIHTSQTARVALIEVLWHLGLRATAATKIRLCKLTNCGDTPTMLPMLDAGHMPTFLMLSPQLHRQVISKIRGCNGSGGWMTCVAASLPAASACTWFCCETTNLTCRR